MTRAGCRLPASTVKRHNAPLCNRNVRRRKMSGPNWNLDDDSKTVTVTFPTNPPVALKLDAANVEDLLKNLGDLRALMTPAVASDYAPGQLVGVIPDLKWMTEPEIMMGASLLHFRDPRYGWLHYLIPPEEARKLAGFLNAQVDTVPQVPRRDVTN